MFTVTQEMLDAINDTWAEFISEGNDEDDDCELYVYVVSYDEWDIDHAQYFTSWNDVLTIAPVCRYASISELRVALEMNISEWEMV